MTTANSLATLGNGPAFGVYLNTNQTVTSGVLTKVTVNTELFDTNNCFDNATNYRFTPTVAGYYQVNGSIGLGSGSISRMLVDIYKNGGEYLRGTDMVVSFANSVTTSCVVYMNGTTYYLELYGLLTGSGTLQIIGNQVLTQFSGCLMRGA